MEGGGVTNQAWKNGYKREKVKGRGGGCFVWKDIPQTLELGCLWISQVWRAIKLRSFLEIVVGELLVGWEVNPGLTTLGTPEHWRRTIGSHNNIYLRGNY